MRRLTQDEEAVLRFLAENKDRDGNDKERISAGTGLPQKAVKRALRHLQEIGYVGGPESLLDRCMRIMREIDPKFSPTSENYADHIVLIASALVGANDDEIAEKLDYDPDFVKTAGSRLRSSGVWVGNKLAEGRFDLWSKDSIGFFCDGAVAAGMLIVADNSDPSNLKYKMTDAGLSKAASLIKKMGGDQSGGAQ